MPSYPKRMARNQEVGLKPISERQVLPLVSDFYEQKITNYLSHRAPWLHSGIIISTVLDIKGNSRENSHNTPTIFLSHVCPQNPRPVHQTSNPPKSLAVCSVSGISFNQSVWLRRENKSPSFKNLFSPTVFSCCFSRKKKRKKQLPQVHQVSPTVQPWLFFTRIRWPRSCGHLPPGPGQRWCAAENSVASLVGGFPKMVALPNHSNYPLVI